MPEAEVARAPKPAKRALRWVLILLLLSLLFGLAVGTRIRHRLEGGQAHPYIGAVHRDLTTAPRHVG
jgi:hypothetical protein